MAKFCQFDEERIIQELWGTKPAGRCAEFGARGRKGSNVAALLDSGWACQLIDKDINQTLHDFPIPGGKREMTDFGSVYRGSASHEIVHATVTKENVNEVLWRDLDLLSIDIDGPDLEVWKAVTQTPEIVIIETNDGPSNKIAILDYAKSRGYRFVERTGVNLVFVHEA